MKKFSGKLIASLFAVAVMASAATVTASAVDYTNDPGYTPEKPTGVVTEDTISAVLEHKEPVVYIEAKTATVKEDAIGAIAKSEKPVTFESATYSVTVDPAKITKVKAINLAMEISATKAETKVDGVEVPAGAVVIAPAQKGDFGMTLEVSIPVKSLGNIDKAKAAVYYVADNGAVTKLDKALSFDKDGNAVISISHASKYVISDVEVKGSVDTNIPNTGVTLPVALVALAGSSIAAAVIIARKRK